MNDSGLGQKNTQMMEEIISFVESSKGLIVKMNTEGHANILQEVDGKVFSFKSTDLIEVLKRKDGDGKSFIQVNFQSGIKVLFTETLVGFKPKETPGLDMSKIPKVVTTPDLVSVFEAIEESLSSELTPDYEVEILRKVFNSILIGGESAGFDLEYERRWLNRLVAPLTKASA